MNKSDTIGNLAKALCSFQSEITNPKNSEMNEFFKSKYAPLPDIINLIKPILTKNKLSVIQSVGGDGEHISVSTTVMHESGEWLETDLLKIKNQEQKGVNVSQAAGISITYARRYSLSAALGISSEDDTDGNLAPRNGDQTGTQTGSQQNQPNKPTTQTGALKCTADGCGKAITPAVKTFSENKYKKALCQDCQKKVPACTHG